MRQSTWIQRLLVMFVALATFGAVACDKSSEESESREESAVNEQGAEEGASEMYTDPDDKFQIAGAPMKGSADALVTIVEFSEFQCPFCSRVLPTTTQILEEYGDDVRIIFKSLPLPMHDRAVPASRAAMAAHQQGKFWEFHDLAFANQRALTDENFTAWAEELGLDMEQFQADYESDEIAAAVDADAALAGELGVRGTPNFYINGQNIRGAQQFPAFKAVIDAELEAMQEAVDGGASREDALAARIEANLGAAAAPAAERRPQARPTPDPEDELYMPVGESPVHGSNNALVTWVIFSEFQCPFCSRVLPTVEELSEEFGDDLRVVFKHNPLGFHDRAVPAAKAAIAAQNQGKFWEFHDLAFQNQRALTDENFVAWAEELGLDIAQFEADMASEETAARVAEDQALAQRAKAGGTPHSFINGYRVRGAQPAQAFRAIIEREIEKANEAIANGATRANVYETLQEDANRGEARMITPEAAPTPAAPAAVEIPVGDNVPFKGDEDATVTIVEYTDWQCPFCSRFANNLDEALEDFTDAQVRVVVKQFPLPFHQQADLASQASLAAHAQGKFWEYHDILWQNQNALHRPQLEEYAEQVGLDMAQFRAALDDGTYAEQVQAELREGQGFGVRGTPTWFVNGVRYSGALPAAQIKQHINTALEAAE